MRPEAQIAMRDTLEHGPSRCPPDLFQGRLDSIIRGLKAHANSVSHARFVALEETYPRTRALIGAECFHAAASEHLAAMATVRRPLARIGENFASHLQGTARDLAAIEWMWIEAHGAADAIPFDLASIAGLTPEAAANAQVALHPAVRVVGVRHPLEFDGRKISGPAILITRPRREVQVAGASKAVACMIAFLRDGVALSELLERDPAACTTLVTSGALILAGEEST